MKLSLINQPPRSVPARFAVAALLAAAMVLAPATIPALLSTASAACPDVEVVFARGRLESPGAGVVGNAFVSALRSKVNRNVGSYAVRYPADTEVDVGANDMSHHIQDMVDRKSVV